MHKNNNETPIAYADKMGKQSKFLQTITLNLELKFEKKIFVGKVLRRRINISH